MRKQAAGGGRECSVWARRRTERDRYELRDNGDCIVIEHGITVGEALLEEDPRHHHVRRRVIIVAPHFPPSNLASVHRSRLLAHHLREFGWEPIIVTVAPGYYEEDLDWELTKLLSSDLRVERVSALPTRPIRFVGDVGIRGFV